jgi:lysophospholipase L1-like esterase
MNTTPPVRCYVALGDSITAGLGDGVSMGRYQLPVTLAGRGWAALLAASLGPPGSVRYANLATTGATAREVRTIQLPTALALQPQLASLVVGMNDVLKPSFDPLRVRHDLVWSIGRLRAEGVIVLTARWHDPTRLLRLPGPVRRRLAGRIDLLNAAVDAAAGSDRGVLVVDLGLHPEAYRLSTFDVDRVHPGPRGHRLLARAFAELLWMSGVPLVDLPAAGREAPPPSTVDHAVWIASVGVPWLLGRAFHAWPRRPERPRPLTAPPQPYGSPTDRLVPGSSGEDRSRASEAGARSAGTPRFGLTASPQIAWWPGPGGEARPGSSAVGRDLREPHASA